MVKKRLKELADEASEKLLANTVRESAQQIWLAGLGAFAKTQQEGMKVFESLVREGKGLETRTRKFASSAVSEMMSPMTSSVEKAANRATATWDRLEQVFEDRVARALHRLGVPTNAEIHALAKRVEVLTESVHRLAARQAAAPRAGAKGAGAKRTRTAAKGTKRGRKGAAA
jgi:poly(hydroxyalkanoate) granule-associated protein